jgi:putative ABC transport system permease protein
VAAVPGVASVQPVLRRPVRVQTPPSREAGAQDMPRSDNLGLLGVDLEAYLPFHGLSLAAGTLPESGRPGLVALAPWAFVRELSLGQVVTLSVPAGQVSLPITGLIEVESLAAAQSGLVLYAPRATVAELFGLPTVGKGPAPVTTLEVRVEDGASRRRVRARLEEALGSAYAVSGTTAPEPQLWQRLVLGALYFVDGLTLLGSATLVYGAFAAGAWARRRQIGLLRAAGATRRQVLAGLLLEALFLGLAGALPGVLLGLLLARAGAGLVLGGSPDPSGAPAAASAALGAVSLGLLAAVAGAIVPALRAARLPPVQALQPAPEKVGPGTDSGSLSRLPALATRWMLARGVAAGGVDFSAALLGRDPGRVLLMVATLALVLAMFLGNVGALSLLGEEMAAGLGRLGGGDYLVLPGLTTISLRELAGQDTSDVPPLSPGLLAALGKLGDQVWLMAGTTADVEALEAFPGQPTLLLDVEGYARMGGFRFQEGAWSEALAAFHRGPAVLLTTAVARRLDAGLGDAVQLPTLRGPVDFVVAGVGDSEFTTCILDLADGAAYLGVNEVSAVMVQVRLGADAGALRQALRDAVRREGGTLLPLDQVTAQLRDIFRQVRLSMVLLIAAGGTVAALGIVNASLSSVAQRRREIGLLRAVGATQRQVVRLLLAEAAVLGGVAAVAGTILGWAATAAFLTMARGTLGLSGLAASSPGTWLPLLAASLAALLLGPILGMVGALAASVAAGRMPLLQALYESI